MTFRNIIEEQVVTSVDVLEINQAIMHLESQTYLNEDVWKSISKSVRDKIEFIKKFAEMSSSKLQDTIKLFKNKNVIKFFKYIKFNFGVLYKIVKNGFKLYEELQLIISRYVTQHKIGKFTEKHLKKLDVFLLSHKKLKNVSGILVAGLLLFIWLNMSFTGDFLYDFDWSDILQALVGNFTLAELFAGEDGFRLLLLFTSGSLLGLSFPWAGGQGVKFITAVAVGLFKLKK